MESGYQQDEASDGICEVQNPKHHMLGLSCVGCGLLKEHLQCKPTAGEPQCSSWSKAVLKANLLFLFSDAPCLPSPLPVPSIYVST